MNRVTDNKIWRPILAAMFFLLGANTTALAKCHHESTAVASPKSCCATKLVCQCEPAPAAHTNTARTHEIILADGNGGCPCDMKSAPIDPAPANVTVPPDVHANVEFVTIEFGSVTVPPVIHVNESSAPIRGSPPGSASPRAPPVLS